MVIKKISKSQLGICYWFFCVFTVLGLAGVTAWQSLIPKNPNFKISNAHFPPINVKNQSHRHNLSFPAPSSSIVFDIKIFNPNKRMGIYYSSITFELYDGGGVVAGRNSTAGFYQGYKNTTILHVPVHAGGEHWQGFNGGGVSFMVRVETNVKFWIIRWKTKVRRIVYEARFSKVNINLNGTVFGGIYVDLQNGSKVRIRN